MEASALSPSAPPVALPRPSPPPVLLRLRSDEQLLALFRGGSEEAFGVLHDRYRPRLLAYVRSMLQGAHRASAEDALQDVFLRAYRALRADERPVAVRAWLYRVAHNRCIDELRRPGPAPAELIELEGDDEHDPGALLERRERLQRLVDDLRRLPGQQRSALLMREMEGLSYQELADALDVTLPAVKSLLVRARMGLAEAAEARDAACADIRADLAGSLDRGVRMSARARRHLRDCEDCRTYREALRARSRALAALAPPHGVLGALAGLVGGGAAGGGLLGGGAGTAAGVAGGGAAAAGATKVAAVVCCVAVTGGAAAGLERRVDPPAPRTAPPAQVAAPAPASTAASAPAAPPAPSAPAPVTTAPAAAEPAPAPAPAEPATATAGETTPAAADPPPATTTGVTTTTTTTTATPPGTTTAVPPDADAAAAGSAAPPAAQAQTATAAP